MSRNVSVVIPNYNGQQLLKENLPSVLRAAKHKVNNILEVIIVDDGSSDDSTKIIKEKFPDVVLIKHTKNRGFSSAVNTGARTAKAELIALLNSDVSPTPKFLKGVIKLFDDESVFGVSLNEGEYGWSKAQFINGFVEHGVGGQEDKHYTFWVNGGSGVFRRSLWMQLGGMDEQIFSPFYWEDIDLSYRANKRAWKTLWSKTNVVKHNHESTMKKLNRRYVSQIQQRNQLLFIWKNITSPILFRKHIAGLFIRLVKHPGYIKIVLRALSKLRQVIKARKKEKKEAKVSDESIFSRF